jgi:hypothetical protein
MLGQRADRPGADVGRRADLERDLLLGQVIEQPLVVGGGDPVADPVGAQQVQGIPDRLRPGGLPGVRDAAQPGRPGLVEEGHELRSGHADLGSAQAEGDQTLRAQA